MFELVRRIENTDVFMKKIIRAATDLVESRPFRRERIASRSAKLAISKVYIYTLKQWIIQTLDFIPPDPESSIRILPINRLQDPRSRKARQTYLDALSSYCLAEIEFFLQNFPQKRLSEPEKNGSAIFQSRPRVKVELTRENGKKTSITGSTGYV